MDGEGSQVVLFEVALFLAGLVVALVLALLLSGVVGSDSPKKKKDTIPWGSGVGAPDGAP